MRAKHKVDISRDTRRLVYADNRVIGQIYQGRFIQHLTRKHLFRKLNSKGIELSVFERLLHEDVDFWQLEFDDTKEILEIPFRDIPKVGILNPPGSAGYQYHVELKDFIVKQAALQAEMFDGGTQKDVSSS